MRRKRLAPLLRIGLTSSSFTRTITDTRTWAINYALDIGILEADAVRLILEHRRERPVKLFRLDGRPHLAEVVVEPPHLAAYRSLLVEV